MCHPSKRWGELPHGWLSTIDDMNFELREDLGRQLTQKRKAKHYTQAELAQRLGITRPQLSDYENGHVVYPTFDVLLKAAEVLETDFAVGGYKLTRGRVGEPAQHAPAGEKQLIFSFYKGRVPRDATIRISTVRRRVVIKATVVGAAG
jgi:transcriptional regulator with XRE-family HTH domain